MTDKPELSWYPTTIDELQRLLDSGVWPRVRAIADDVGPLQIAQGRLTYIDIEKDGMSGILREGPAPAGAEPFDLTSRTLWLWRAESSASSTPKPWPLASSAEPTSQRASLMPCRIVELLLPKSKVW